MGPHTLPRDALCCPPDVSPPVVLDYTPLGTSMVLGDLPVYQTGTPTSRMALIALPDIFSFGYAQVRKELESARLVEVLANQ